MKKSLLILALGSLVGSASANIVEIENKSSFKLTIEMSFVGRDKLSRIVDQNTKKEFEVGNFCVLGISATQVIQTKLPLGRIEPFRAIWGTGSDTGTHIVGGALTAGVGLMRFCGKREKFEIVNARDRSGRVDGISIVNRANPIDRFGRQIIEK